VARLGLFVRATVLIVGVPGFLVLIGGLWLLGGGARVLLGGQTWVRVCLGLLLGVILVVIGYVWLIVIVRWVTQRSRHRAV
jgi:hypothetical protein